MLKTWKVENFKMTVPYTYMVTFLPTNQKYYGVRFANGCSTQDLWSTYFTSSSTIHNLIEKHGEQSFKAEIRKLFTNKEDALKWENRFLTKVKALQNPMFLNKNIGGQYFDCTGIKKPKHSKFMLENNPAKVPGVMDCIKGENNPAKRAEVRKKLSEFNVSKRPEIKQLRRIQALTNNPASREDVRLKIKQSAQNRVKLLCQYCNKSATPGLFARWHGEKCKNKNGD
jgi:hypothetical protein